MKSKLLLSLFFIFFFSANLCAQLSRHLNATKSCLHEVPCILESSSTTATKPIIRKSGSGNHTMVADLVTIGSAPNALTCSNSSRSNLWYDKDINTVVFVHRLTGRPTVGYVGYDRSTDVSLTVFDTSKVVYSNAPDDVRGRYPLCAVYNPVSNTDPNNAYIAYAGPWTNAAGGWHGSYFGVGRLNNTGATQHYDSNTGFVENVFETKTKDIWRVGSMYDGTWADQKYLDTIILSKGTWTGSDYSFTYTNFPAPADPLNPFLDDQDIAFADDGLTGYIVTSTYNSSTFLDTVLTLKVYITTNGGSTWSSTVIDTRAALDAILANDISIYGVGFDLDVVVDMNKNLHIITTVHPSGYNGTGIVVVTQYDTWCIFDIYTTNQGLTWNAQLLAKPESFRGTFGTGTAPNSTLAEDNRPFAARTWDGSKLFFGWFETDTAVYAPDPTYGENWAPDLHVKGYDLNTGYWTNDMNLTQGTNADGFCAFGNGSYYVRDNAGAYTIPAVIQQLSSLDATGTQTQLYYVKDATVSSTDFTVPGSSVLLVNIDNIKDVKHNMSVSSNYPNPFTGKTSVDITLPQPADVTIEISNLVGQVLSTKLYENLRSGKNTITIDGPSLAKGLYIYKVKTGDDVVAKIMAIE